MVAMEIIQERDFMETTMINNTLLGIKYFFDAIF
jgi:hypothetical protein